MSEKKTTAMKSTETAKEGYRFVKRLYAKAREASSRGAPVAWVMGGLLAEEMLYAMDVVPIYPENYGGVCAAKKGADPFLKAADAEGYSTHLCGYVRTGIGHAIKRKQLGMVPPDAPEGGMADPVMLVGSSACCDPRYKWFQALGRYMNVPYIAYDIVPDPVQCSVDPDEVKEYVIAYLIEEFRRFRDFLEKTLGRKMDDARLMEAVVTGEETRNWWWKCDMIRRAVPCPMPTEDMFSCFVPGLFYAPDPESLEFFKKLYAELEHRVQNKMGVIPDEKYRLLWGWGLPPWHSMNIFNHFEERGAVFVAETCYTPYGPFEEGYKYSDPIERMARGRFHRANFKMKKAYGNRLNREAQYVVDFVDEFRCDGLVQHQVLSCPARTIGQRACMDMIKKFVDVPVMFLEGDIVDESGYSETQTKAQIDAFIEILEAHKRKGRS